MEFDLKDTKTHIFAKLSIWTVLVNRAHNFLNGVNITHGVVM